MSGRDLRFESIPPPMAGYSIADLEATGVISRGPLYRAIREGRLVARKHGKRTIILPADWERFLQSLPKVGIDVPFTEPVALRQSRSPAAASQRRLTKI
jgi:hypothetical protein